VLIVSENQLSVALEFSSVPPFAVRLLRNGGVVGVHSDTGKVVMLLGRVMLNNRPWGPWVEVTHGGHYEIEERCQ